MVVLTSWTTWFNGFKCIMALYFLCTLYGWFSYSCSWKWRDDLFMDVVGIVWMIWLWMWLELYGWVVDGSGCEQVQFYDDNRGNFMGWTVEHEFLVKGCGCMLQLTQYITCRVTLRNRVIKNTLLYTWISPGLHLDQSKVLNLTKECNSILQPSSYIVSTQVCNSICNVSIYVAQNPMSWKLSYVQVGSGHLDSSWIVSGLV